MVNSLQTALTSDKNLISFAAKPIKKKSLSNNQVKSPFFYAEKMIGVF